MRVFFLHSFSLLDEILAKSRNREYYHWLSGLNPLPAACLSMGHHFDNPNWNYHFSLCQLQTRKRNEEGKWKKKLNQRHFRTNRPTIVILNGCVSIWWAQIHLCGILAQMFQTCVYRLPLDVWCWVLSVEKKRFHRIRNFSFWIFPPIRSMWIEIHVLFIWYYVFLMHLTTHFQFHSIFMWHSNAPFI